MSLKVRFLEALGERSALTQLIAWLKDTVWRDQGANARRNCVTKKIANICQVSDDCIRRVLANYTINFEPLVCWIKVNNKIPVNINSF